MKVRPNKKKSSIVGPGKSPKFFEFLEFDLTNTTPPPEGTVNWNSDDGTLQVGMPGGSVALQLGQELLLRVKASGDLANGKVVYVSGATGSRPIASLADNSSLDTASAIAVMTETVLDNQFGFATTFGLVRDLDTSGCTAGDILWLGASGNFTNVRPIAPEFNVVVGICLYAHATEGVILTKIDIVPRLQGLSDVYITSLTEGQSIYWNDTEGRFEVLNLSNVTKEPTGFFDPDNIVVTDNGNNTVTLSSAVEGTDIAAYYDGVHVPALTDNYTSPTNTGSTSNVYILTYNGTDTAWRNIAEYPLFYKDIQISAAFYDTNNSQWVYTKETHGLMPWQTHKEFHQRIGTYKQSGGSVTGYTLSSTTAADRRPDISATVVQDEDNATSLAALLESDQDYTQGFNTGTGTFTFDTENVDIIPLSTTNPYYNSFSSPNWGQTLFPANSVGSVWVFALPVVEGSSTWYRYLFVQPQWVTQSLNQSAFELAKALSAELNRSISELTLTSFTGFVQESVAIARITITYTLGDWYLSSVSTLSGSRYSQVQAPSGNFLSSVSTDGLTIEGTGVPSDPVKLVDIPSYADNTAALAGGLVAGQLYHTSGAVKVVI